jgi:NAD+ dependent glucose-6-phosphate dehydrogenase
MNKPKLLITGVNGLIGSIISSPLQKAFDVYGFDVNGPFSDRVFQTDISAYDQLTTVFEKIDRIQFVVHLAGQSSTTAAWDAVLQANIAGTRNIYEAARVFKVQRVVFASSNHVTGAYEGFEPHLHLHLQYEPDRITVQHPIRPDSDYGVSKAFGEAVARYYCARWGIESICLRIGSVRPDDNPAANLRFAKTWLSHRDLIELIEKSLTAGVTFGIYYGISNNRGAFWDISNARSELGYNPIDDAARLEV